MKKRKLIAYSILKNDAQIEFLPKNLQKSIWAGRQCYQVYCICPGGDWIGSLCDGVFSKIINSCGGNPWDNDWGENCTHN